MKKNKNYSFKIVAITSALTMIVLTGIAQKSAAQNIPTAIKIDGNATEWNKQDQRYNKNTSMYYMVSNDNNNIYLILTAVDKIAIRKMILGGVTFSVSTSNNKKFKNASAITFPTYTGNSALYMYLNDMPNTRSTTEPVYDSVMNSYNKQLATKFKFIGLTGIKEIPDSAISVYNENTIKVAAKFDNKLHYTYELALPIKYLHLSHDATQINYNIKLNGGANSNYSLIPGRNVLIYKGADGVNYTMGSESPQNLDLITPTDFNGEYTLVKN